MVSSIGPFPGANLDLVDALLRQLRHVIDLAGPEHVELGLGYVFDRTELDEHVRQNASLYPPGVEGSLAIVEPEAIGVIAEGLARNGFTDPQIRGIPGDNWLRIATQVWR